MKLKSAGFSEKYYEISRCPYKWVDRNGVYLCSGSHVRWVPSDSTSSPYDEGLDGWVFEIDGNLHLFINDDRNDLYCTGIYWEFDYSSGEPISDLEYDW